MPGSDDIFIMILIIMFLQNGNSDGFGLDGQRRINEILLLILIFNLFRGRGRDECDFDDRNCR